MSNVSVQNAATKKLWLCSSILLWLMVGIALVLVIRKPDTPAAKMEPRGNSSLAGHEIPDFSLVNTQGETFGRSDLLGRPWVASFLFTQCTKECPAIASRIENLAKTVEGSNVRFVTISVDPKRDTPEVLRKYAASRQVDEDRWLFLTGDVQQVTALVTEGFLQSIKDVEETSTGLADVLHSPRLILVGADGRIVETYNGQDEVDVAKLRRDIAKLPRIDREESEPTKQSNPSKSHVVVSPSDADQSTERDVPRDLEDFELVSHLGKKVTRGDLIGQPWVASFVFTRCRLTCPTITLAMKNLHDQLKGVNVKFVGITVDPKHDTPEILRDYAEAFGSTDPQFLFLTGEQEPVYRLITYAFRIYAQEYDGAARKPGYEVAHSNRVVLVDAKGRVVDSFLATNDVEMVRLRRALEGKSKLGMSIFETSDGIPAIEKEAETTED